MAEQSPEPALQCHWLLSQLRRRLGLGHPMGRPPKLMVQQLRRWADDDALARQSRFEREYTDEVGYIPWLTPETLDEHWTDPAQLELADQAGIDRHDPPCPRAGHSLLQPGDPRSAGGHHLQLAGSP